jgi:hypothetical protein
MKPSADPAIERRHSAVPNSAPLLSALQSCMRTREARAALGTLIADALRLWSGDSALKQKLARPVARQIETRFKRSRPNDRDNRSGLVDLVTELVNASFSHLLTAAEAMEALDPEEKHKRIEAFGASFGSGRSGRFLTSLTRSLNEVHAAHPDALAAAIAPAVRAWVASTDFGALRDAADAMGPEVQALAAEINAILWRYPAKLVLSLSFLPELLNLAAICTNETLRGFNQASPDLVADIGLALIRSIDGERLGTALNELSEVIRKAHTGSALIGEPGRPQLADDLRALSEAVADRLDAETFWQARVALAEDKAALAGSLNDALGATPDFVAAGLKTYARRQNPEWEVRRRRLEALDDLPDEILGAGLAEGLSDLDLQAVAEITNRVTTLFDRVMALKPELIPDLVRQLADALDLDAIEASIGGAAAACGPALRPVLRALLPDLVTLLGDALAPADDAFEDQMAHARRRLRALLIDPETRP